MTTLNARAASLSNAWRNANDLAPVAFEALALREQSVWLTVAAATPEPRDEREQWTVAVVAGKGARAKPQMVLTAPNAEVILSGELAGPTTVQELVDAGLRGFRIE